MPTSSDAPDNTLLSSDNPDASLSRKKRKQEPEAESPADSVPSRQKPRPKKQHQLPVRAKDSLDTVESEDHSVVNGGVEAEPPVVGNLEVSAEKQSVEDPLASKTGPTKHKFFDDDDGELGVEPVSILPASSSLKTIAAGMGTSEERVAVEEEGDSDAESDDEAPEAVSTHKAAEQIKGSALAATKVAEQYEGSLNLISTDSTNLK